MSATPTSHVHPSRQRRRIAIVGGGVSGLAAAQRLRNIAPNAEIRLYERSERLGGALCTTETDGLLFERGADSFITKLPWAMELCRELGIEDQLIATNQRHRRALVLRDDALHPIPEGFVIMRPEQLASVIKSPLLSWRGRIRICAEPFIHPRRQDALQSPDESVAEFATRRLGVEAYERLVEPLLAGIYVGDGRKLSIAATMPEFPRAEMEHGSLYLAARAARWSAQGVANRDRGSSGARYGAFVAPREGLSTLISALAKSLQQETIQLKSEVQRIRRVDDRWKLDVLREGSRSEAEFDGLVIAAPASLAGSLLVDIDADLSSLLQRIEYVGSCVVTLIYDRRQFGRPLDAFGFVVPAVERRSIVAASFPSIKFPARGETPETPIRVFLGGALHPEALECSDDKLADLAIAEIGPLLSISGRPARYDVARWPASMPQYHVGHVQLVDEIERRTSQIDGLELAGNAYRGVGIPQCIHSGQAAAERLVD